MGQDNQAQSRQYTNEETPSDKKCVPPNDHVSTKVFKCDTQNCTTIICKCCMGGTGSAGQRYCVLCAINNQEDQGDDWEDLGEERGGKVVAGSFQSTFSVKADAETGQIIGWDDFFLHIDKDSSNIKDFEEVQSQLKRKMQATYKIIKHEGNVFTLKN